MHALAALFTPIQALPHASTSARPWLVLQVRLIGRPSDRSLLTRTALQQKHILTH